MQKTKIMEDKVKSAVKEYVSSLQPGSKVVSDMSALIDVTSELPLSGFDFWERFISSECTDVLRASVPPRWAIWLKPNAMITWLDLISRDGYRREKTLRTLSGAAPNTFFFSLAVRRLNDWVPQVRKAAREMLPQIAKATEPEYVVDALCIALSNWHSWGRIEDVDKNLLLQIISEERIAAAFRSKLISSASGPMPSLFSQLGRTGILDNSIEEIATLAKQPSVRAKAYRSLFENRITWIEGRKWEWTDVRYCEGRLKPVISERQLNVQLSISNLIQSSAEDRSSVVRRVSAEVLIRELEALGDAARGLAQKFAVDKSSSVSERGRFALKKLEELKRT